MKTFRTEYNLSNLELYNHSEAIKVIEYCRKKNKRILGFDAFIIYDDKRVQPSMENSADYTRAYQKCLSGNWDKAIEDINKADEKFVFEIIY